MKEKNEGLKGLPLGKYDRDWIHIIISGLKKKTELESMGKSPTLIVILATYLYT